MKKLLVFVLALSFLYSKAQVAAKPDSLLFPVVETQGNIMAKLLLQKDYKGFVKYTYPPIVKMSGGETKLVALIQKSFKDMGEQGFTIKSINVSKPTSIIHSAKKLQCVVTQTLEMTTPKGRMVTIAYLIGNSDDNGKSWTFIDTHGADLTTLRKSIPGLSTQLVIPEAQEPVMYEQ